MIRLRPLLTLLLAAALAWAGVTMAVARGQAPLAERMVICSGYGMVVVDLDAEGNPVGPVHLCPDCTLALLPGPLAAPAAPRPAPRLLHRLLPPAAPASAGKAVETPRARGPPPVSL